MLQTRHQTLLDIYTPAVTYGLEIHAKLKQNAPPDYPPANDVYNEFKSILTTCQDAAQKAGKSAGDVDTATFIMVAWVDDLFACAPQWWPKEFRLQMEFFGRNTLGDDFYAHLRDCPPERQEVREMYFAALGLGFAGAQAALDQSGREVDRLKGELAATLPILPIDPMMSAEDGFIHRQPYDVADPDPLPLIKRSKPLWPYLLAVLALVLLGLLGAVLWMVLNAKPDIDKISADVERLTQAVQCSYLTPTVNDQAEVTIQGYAGAQSDLDALEQDVLAIDGVDGVNMAGTTVEPPPYCEVMRVLDGGTNSDGGGLTLEVNATDGTYKVDDQIVMNMTSRDAQGFLTLSLVDSGGSIVHFYPQTPVELRRLRPGAEVSVGLLEEDANPGDRVYYVTPDPLQGRMMFFAIWSETPLFRPARAAFTDDLDSYLAALQQRFDAAAQQDEVLYSTRVIPKIID